jgi:hypothetical protein
MRFCSAEGGSGWIIDDRALPDKLLIPIPFL